MIVERPPIRYRIAARHPEAHLFEVSVTVERPDPAGQTFTLPAWIPGSYMIREFARHVVRISARCGRRAVALEKLDKHTWRAAPCDGALTVQCEVYAWDLSVRGAHLDTTHGFFNGPCVFLRVEGQAESPCEVEILPPAGVAYRRWRVATTLARTDAPATRLRHLSRGELRRADRSSGRDGRVHAGPASRRAASPHEIAITGRHAADLDRLARDLERIAAQQIDFFGGRAPLRHYLFLVTAVGDGYGGLEHRASTALLVQPRRSAPPGFGKHDDATVPFSASRATSISTRGT